MSYQQHGIQLNNFADLIKYQLMLVGRASANVGNVDEHHMQLGATSYETFTISVRALVHMLHPVWDTTFKSEITDYSKNASNSNPYNLLSSCMDLIFREKIMFHIEEIEVHDPEAEQWNDNDLAERQAKQDESKKTDDDFLG